MNKSLFVRKRRNGNKSSGLLIRVGANYPQIPLQIAFLSRKWSVPTTKLTLSAFLFTKTGPLDAQIPYANLFEDCYQVRENLIISAEVISNKNVYLLLDS